MCAAMLVLLPCAAQGAVVVASEGSAQLSAWDAPPGAHVTLAALCGQHLALACGCVVQCLYASATGRLLPEGSMQLEQQVSALALFKLADSEQEGAEDDPAVGGALWVAAGLWVLNRVVLQPLAEGGGAAPCTLDLGEHQPRSLLVCQLGGGGARHLVVGTSTGEVLFWELHRTSAPGELQALHGRWVRAGVAPVDLSLLPAAPAPPHDAPAPRPQVLARSDQALLLGANLQSAGLEAVRLHGGTGLAALCAFRPEDAPANGVAWAGPDGQLCVGQLQVPPTAAAAELQWDHVLLGATPQALAYHAASGCAAVACVARDGSSSLRLVDVAAGAEVARLPLAHGHAALALCTAALPCSASPAAKAAAHQQQPLREVLVVSSALQAGPLAIKQGGGGPPPAPAASSQGDAWWRCNTLAGSDAPAEEAAPAPAHPQGLLSFFDVLASPGASAQRLELVLLGTWPLAAPAFSLAAVEPAPAESLLAAGCPDGVHLLRAFVDAYGEEAAAAARRGLAAIAVAEPLKLGPQGAMSVDDPAAASSDTSDSAAAALDDRQCMWRQRVALQTLGKVCGAGWGCAATTRARAEGARAQHSERLRPPPPHTRRRPRTAAACPWRWQQPAPAPSQRPTSWVA